MAHPINHTAIRMAYHPLPQAKPAIKDEEKESTGSSTSSAARGGGAKHNSLAIAMEMHDDLSALLPSLRQRRTEERAGAHASGAWIDHVLDEHAPEKCASLKDLLKQGSWDAARILLELQALFADTSDLLAALNAFACDPELEHLRAELHKARQRLMEGLTAKQARAAKAGLNAAVKARLGRSGSVLMPAMLRQCYRDFMGGQLDVMSQYELWMRQYDFEHRHRILDFIEQALGADIYSLDPSCSRLEFGQLLHQVRLLATLRSADDLLIRQCMRQPWSAALSLDGAHLLSGVFAVVRMGGGLDTLFSGPLAMVRMGLNAADRARFAQALRWAFKALPYSLWPDVQFQLNVLNELEAFTSAAISAEVKSNPNAKRWHV